MRVIWAPPARADLDAILDYIAPDNLSAALTVVARIERVVARLANYPGLGRPGRVAGSRELVVAGTPYVVIYRLGSAEAEVGRVVHGAQEWLQP